ncbi:hypothetical protein DL766_008726 [Monosporascus sp. MC13-8B]|uniref:UmuC domain-containing protein n=1 Tax=Monosporascus cannonballus TaxID=155416 RepID=A0ABY0GWM5_9PEZI|nr:hypothetical protein DL762_008500 [Monosporascus cannonballus]RYO88724.1 hypothetical protein DL763_005893 [Monosporascus cannonballus]RYP18230.1 hypothetical protein DL766_008726 [Monosporascus sp. MC13-8B]
MTTGLPAQHEAARAKIGEMKNKEADGDGRVILHFDYDCFYASVIENAHPALRMRPLGVRQKSILATCNYAARTRGVRKLMPVAEARAACPDLVVVCGEDLAPFRDASRRLWAFLRGAVAGARAERLGLDEVFLDVTAAVAYNRALLNPNALRDSFFHLSAQEPERGFTFDATRFAGCVHPLPDGQGGQHAGAGAAILDDPVRVRLMLASHLAGYLRRRLEEDFVYTSSGGISTNKVLAKLAGSVNKPRNQTTLLPVQGKNTIQEFLDAHQIREIPGIGSRTSSLIADHLFPPGTAAHIGGQGAEQQTPSGITVRDVLRHPGMSPALLTRILDRPGAERGGGKKVWNLLHGVDTSEVKEAGVAPTQISVEDTYMARPLNALPEVLREMHAVATSLVRRMRVDLTTAAEELTDPSSAGCVALPPRTQQKRRWLAYPKTLRLSTCAHPGKSGSASSTSNPSFSRISRSQSLPSFALDLERPCAEVAERLVREALLPLFRRLHVGRAAGWNLALLNVCVANMVPVAGDDGGGGGGAAGGRNISRMFQTQGERLREWSAWDDDATTTKATTASPSLCSPRHGNGVIDGDAEDGAAANGASEGKNDVEDAGSASAETEVWAADDGDSDSDVGWEDEDGDSVAQQRCAACGHAVPIFAMSAHERFHALGD